MSGDYYGRIRATLEKFCRPDDQLRCIANYDQPYLTCQMCGHPCIRDIYVLANQRTGQKLLVGCRCIVAYRRVHEQLGQKVKPVLFPPALRALAAQVNSHYSGTAAVEDEQAEMDRLVTTAGSQRLQAAGRGTDPDDRKRGVGFRCWEPSPGSGRIGQVPAVSGLIG